MDYFKLLRKQDFNKKLTNEDLKKIKIVLPEIKDVEQKKTWLYEKREELAKNTEISNIISNKIFAGQLTVKLYRIKDDIDKNVMAQQLESQDFKYNKQEMSSNDTISIYSTIKFQERKYVIRVMYNNGMKFDYEQEGKIPDIKYIDVILDINTGIIQVRTEINKARKIMVFIKAKLKLANIDEIRVLSRHNTIEEFARAIKGHFKKIFSNTSIQINELNSNDVMALGELVLALDDYLINKDTSMFIEKLEAIKFEKEGITFTETFLAGCNQIGISVSNQQDQDLSNQGLYKVLNKYLSNDNGYISFKLNDQHKESTIRLSTGVNKNTVQFISSVDEEEVELVISNIITNEVNVGLDASEVIALSNDIMAFIDNKNTNAIRIEHLVNNFNLSEGTVINILEDYVEKGFLRRKFEVVCENDASVLLEINDILEIKETRSLECPVCGNSYEIEYINKMVFNENRNIINLMYVKTERCFNELTTTEKVEQSQIISQMLEKELNGNFQNSINDERERISPLKIFKKVASILF